MSPPLSDTSGDPSGKDVAPREKAASVLSRLRAQVSGLTTASDNSLARFSCGATVIDRLLPQQGLRPDAITEWVADVEGGGAASLSMLAAASQLRCANGPLVVVADKAAFYPPAAIAWGVPASRLLWVCPTNHRDAIWAIDQSLRCAGVAAVWAPLGHRLDDRDARRLQLAAETGETPGLLVRPASVRGRPSFADTRFHVATIASDPQPPLHSPAPHDAATEPSGSGRTLQITLDRCRAGRVGRQLLIRLHDQTRVEEITSGNRTDSTPAWETTDHETAVMRLASELAHPATPKARRRRA